MNKHTLIIQNKILKKYHCILYKIITFKRFQLLINQQFLLIYNTENIFRLRISKNRLHILIQILGNFKPKSAIDCILNTFKNLNKI